jgi:uncharacterized protein DUF1573
MGQFDRSQPDAKPVIRKATTGWLRCLLSLLLLGTWGCSGSSDSDSPRRKQVLPWFVAQGNAAECLCRPMGEQLARAELGLDPTQLRVTEWQDPAALGRLLRDEAEASGGQIRVRKAKDFIKELAAGEEPGPQSLTLLVHENGHLYGLIGTVDLAGQLAFQLTHGPSSIWLVSHQELEKAGFREAWQWERSGEGIPIRIGEGLLAIDKIYHNLGEVEPYEEVRCSFRLENRGTGTVILGKPKTSCSCAVPSLQEDMTLPPGESEEFDVVLNTRATPSIQHMVNLRFSEQGTGASRLLNVQILGSQERSMRISPSRIDFGEINPGEGATRVVTLGEEPTDRFGIDEVRLDGLPVACECRIESSQSNTGASSLQTYEIHLEIDVPSGFAAGEYESQILVQTSSRHRPRVEIPFRLQVAPPFRVVPKVVSFGAVEMGSTIEEQVVIESCHGETMKASVDALPQDVTVEIEETSTGRLLLLIKFVPRRSGIWEDKIHLSVGSVDTEEQLTIPVAALVQ